MRPPKQCQHFLVSSVSYVKFLLHNPTLKTQDSSIQSLKTPRLLQFQSSRTQYPFPQSCIFMCMKFLQDRWHFVWCFPSLPKAWKLGFFSSKAQQHWEPTFAVREFGMNKVYATYIPIVGFRFFRSPHLLEFLAPWLLWSDGYRNIWYTPSTWIIDSAKSHRPHPPPPYTFLLKTKMYILHHKPQIAPLKFW